jgi:hypothetical protein
VRSRAPLPLTPAPNLSRAAEEAGRVTLVFRGEACRGSGAEAAGPGETGAPSPAGEMRLEPFDVPGDEIIHLVFGEG